MNSKKIVTVLGVFLALQASLAVPLLWQGQQTGFESESLLNIEGQDINRLVIADSDNEVELKREDEAWLLPSLSSLPATASKVEGLLAKLSELESSWPVATSASSHERFEVAEDKFQRRLQLFDGEEQVAELFVGTSPGFRKAHLRKSGDDEVLALRFNIYDAPADPEQWLDQLILRTEDITRIIGPDYEINKQASEWQLASEEGQLDPAKVQQLETAFATFRIQGLAEQKPDAEPVRVKAANGNGEWEYRFFKNEDDHFVQRSDRELTFRVSKYDYDRIAGFTRESLLQAEAKTSAETEEKVETSTENTGEN